MAHRRHTISGVVREGALLTLFGGSSLLGFLAQINSLPVAPATLAEMITRLGVSGALLALVWFTRQQLVEEVKRRADLVKEMTERHATEMAAVNKLRLEESREFEQRLDTIHQSGKADLQRIYAETAAERAKFVEAVLAKTATKKRGKSIES